MEQGQTGAQISASPRTGICLPGRKCEEFDGSGWLVDVRSVTQLRAHVRFVHARNAQAKAWQSVWLSPDVLHKLPSVDVETTAVCCALCDQQLITQTCADCDVDWGIDPATPSQVTCAAMPMPTQDIVLDLYMGSYDRTDSYSALMKIAGHVCSAWMPMKHMAVEARPTCSNLHASTSSL
jgi:hypothetical protein